MSEQRNDGGPAFPYVFEQITHDCIRPITQGGMSLRDYFAAKVMQGLLANTSGRRITERVKMAFEIADAMLAEREQSGAKP